MPTILTEDFHLEHTLFSGQAFRWDKVESEGIGGCYGLIDNIPVRVEQRGAKLRYDSYEPLARKRVKRYLGLDHPFSHILDSVSRDTFIETAIEQYQGMRIVRTEPFECLISFICSAFSNIPRIRQSLDQIAKRQSSPVQFHERTFVPFPSREQLLAIDENALRGCGVGYRAPYLQKAITLATKELLENIEDREYKEGKSLLMDIPGVGDKVADCVLLFSFNRFKAFPVDVWIQRIMQTQYFKGRRTTHRQIREFAAGYFGTYAGYAQQYLFQYARRNKTPPREKI